MELDYGKQDKESSESSPINNLPPELLAQILVLWSDMDEDAPWMAAAVCHHWRKVALATNRIWSNITLRFVPDEEIGAEWANEEELAELKSPRGKRRPHILWIERAHDTDISLHVTAFASYPHMETQLYQTLAGLQDHIERLRRVVLHVQFNYLADAALEILLQRAREISGFVMPYLEVELSEKTPKEYRVANPTPDVSLDQFWDYCPPAKALIFRSCYPPRCPQPHSLAHVQTLVVSGVPMSCLQFMKDLENFTSLRSLTLEARSLDDENILPLSAAVTLQHLTDLSLHNVDTQFCSRALALLIAPSLASLSIRNGGLKELRALWGPQEGSSWYDCMTRFGEALEAFVQRSPTLRILHLDRCPIDDRHFLRVLQASPMLEELHMEFLLIGTPAMRGLLPSSSRGTASDQVTCPRLRRLTVENCSSIKKRDLLALLEARCVKTPSTVCLPIEELTIFGCEQLVGIDSDITTWLRSAQPRVIMKDIE